MIYYYIKLFSFQCLYYFVFNYIKSYVHIFCFENISSKFDLIVSNPPYISSDEIDELERDVKDYDPLIALSPGKDGLLAYQKIGRDAFSCLEVSGRLILEIGMFQGPEVTQILKLFDFKQIETHKDLEGHDRVVSCIR